MGGVCKGLLLNGCKSRQSGLIESGMDVGRVAERCGFGTGIQQGV
ncbi:hypothetical protein ABXJ76_08205 [Methylobacter sp. G7]